MCTRHVGYTQWPFGCACTSRFPRWDVHVQPRLQEPIESRVRHAGFVCTAHLAKGLEFDHVVLPEANQTNYQTDMDRNLLYVGCTRAMHRLTLTATGEVTTCLAPAS